MIRVHCSFILRPANGFIPFALSPTGLLHPSPASGMYPDPPDDTACTLEEWEAKVDQLLAELAMQEDEP